MGTNAFKQIVRTIQNKIPVSKGLIRRSRETEQGYLADIHNFELEDGTLKFRQGTRLMANMVDELWYDIQSFKFGNTELVMGINYKRELWGWLAKWPETSFKIWNTSPFRRAYPHVNATSGKPETNGHFSFERGNKFYMLEDNFSVILVNDYAEIFRIMKNGCFRITADYDYADQREAIQDARDDDSLSEGRIYLDIKEATNRVFNERMYIGDEYIRRSHRITGETRFAWVNELNVVSELSDPIEIEGYRHVVASLFPIIKYNNINKTTPVKRFVSPGAVVSDNCNIYTVDEDSTIISATEGQTWNPTNPFTNIVPVSAIILQITSLGKWYDNSGVVKDIDPGIYMCISRKDTGEIIDLDDVDWNFNVVDLPFKTPDLFVRDGSDIINVPSPWKDERKKLQVVRGGGDFYSVLKTDNTKGFGVARIKFNGGEFQRFLTNYYTGSTQIFSGNIEMDSAVLKWTKMTQITGQDTISEVDSTAFQICDEGKTPVEFPYIFGFGRIYQCDFSLRSDTTGIIEKYGWHEQNIVGFEAEFGSYQYAEFENIGYDCWKCNAISNLSVSNIDLDKMVFNISGVNAQTDVILKSNAVVSEQQHGRFALWNNNHIMGISQRAFINGAIVDYEGTEQSETNNLNISNPADVLEIGYLPLMTLDYTGLRRIPMPLPMIRRAMRNPQHLTTAGGKVYSVEDNKIWVGSVDDFMMTDFIEIHSAIDHIASMDTGIVVSTRQGLFYVASGEGIKRVIGGEMIMSKFLAPCSGGVLSVDGRDIHIIYKQVTDSGAWYPSVAKINNALTEINLEGEIKSVSIGDMIYIADDWNVWIYDMANKVWAGKKHYKNRIHRLFGYKNKLGVAFETGVDRRNSFPLEGREKS